MQCVSNVQESQHQFTPIFDGLCEKHIRGIKQDMPEVGYNMLRGLLRAQDSIPRIQ